MHTKVDGIKNAQIIEFQSLQPKTVEKPSHSDLKTEDVKLSEFERELITEATKMFSEISNSHETRVNQVAKEIENGTYEFDMTKLSQAIVKKYL